MSTDNNPGTLVYAIKPFSGVNMQYVPLIMNRNRSKSTYSTGNIIHRYPVYGQILVPLPANDLLGWIEVLNTKPPYPLMGKNHSRVIDARCAVRDFYRGIYIPEGSDYPESDIYHTVHGVKLIDNVYGATLTILLALQKLGHCVAYKYYTEQQFYISPIAYVALTQMPLELLKYFKFIAA